MGKNKTEIGWCELENREKRYWLVWTRVVNSNLSCNQRKGDCINACWWDMPTVNARKLTNICTLFRSLGPQLICYWLYSFMVPVRSPPLESIQPSHWYKDRFGLSIIPVSVTCSCIVDVRKKFPFCLCATIILRGERLTLLKHSVLWLLIQQSLPSQVSGWTCRRLSPVTSELQTRDKGQHTPCNHTCS